MVTVWGLSLLELPNERPHSVNTVTQPHLMRLALIRALFIALIPDKCLPTFCLILEK
jgi:hypothetical protein